MAQSKDRNHRHRKAHSTKREAIANPQLPENTIMMLAGYAVLGKDDITGFKMWKTFDYEGKDHVNLSPAQPLVFPVANLQIGTKVELYVPVPIDDIVDQVQNVPGGNQSQETAPIRPTGNSPS